MVQKLAFFCCNRVKKRQQLRLKWLQYLARLYLCQLQCAGYFNLLHDMIYIYFCALLNMFSLNHAHLVTVLVIDILYPNNFVNKMDMWLNAKKIISFVFDDYSCLAGSHSSWNYDFCFSTKWCRTMLWCHETQLLTVALYTKNN